MTPGEETERTGEGRTVLEDTSRVGDVTGKKMAKWESLRWCSGAPKNVEGGGS